MLILDALVVQAVDSWIEKLDVADLRPLLSALFSRYVDPTLEYCRRNFKYVVPIPAISQVMSICKILESILPQVCSQQLAYFPSFAIDKHGQSIINLASITTHGHCSVCI